MRQATVMTVRWVTLEGIEGAGKTYLGRKLATRLGNRCRLLSEVTDAAPETFTSQVIAALSRSGDLWLRTGHPVTETLALLALKAGEYERAASGARMTEIIVEDRGIDSVAVYQALILAGPDAIDAELDRATELVYATAAHWCPLPDLTLLLVDNTAACVARFEERTGHAISAADLALINGAARLYARLAASAPARFRVIDRTGRSEDETVSELVRACADPDGGE
jgi:dTMP kinase